MLFWQLSILRPLDIIYSYIYTKRSIYILSSLLHSVISSPPPPPLHSPVTSGAKGVRVSGPNSSAGWWERVTGGDLHSRAWTPRCWGFLGYGAVWAIWAAESGRVQRHHLRTCALHVEASELRPGEDAYLCGAPSGPTNRVPHTLHA